MSINLRRWTVKKHNRKKSQPNRGKNVELVVKLNISRCHYRGLHSFFNSILTVEQWKRNENEEKKNSVEKHAIIGSGLTINCWPRLVIWNRFDFIYFFSVPKNDRITASRMLCHKTKAERETRKENKKWSEANVVSAVRFLSLQSNRCHCQTRWKWTRDKRCILNVSLEMLSNIWKKFDNVVRHWRSFRSFSVVSLIFKTFD